MGRIMKWVLLLQEYGFDIMDRLVKKDRNANALYITYERIWYSYDDAKFSNGSLFSMKIIPNEYIDIWNHSSL